MFKFYKLYSLAFVSMSLLVVAGCFNSDKGSEKNIAPELVIINVLDKADFDDCHIQGSVNISFDAFESAMKKFNKNNHYVIYCADYMCMSSGFCAKLLKDAKFEHVWAYEGGMAEWYQKGFPCQGPAESDYLKGENVNLSDEEDETMIPVISAEELLAKIEEFSSKK
ncbi:rhodanese-like domain-containing protein [Candidatus Babeliales bacterium]|nr:rhodanese-like domain-containing protein [Candidatus Babeliales bacterium]MBP9843783.1 rhodanese-like domain-containing protein [Candidatus Babeliales bacterium]